MTQRTIEELEREIFKINKIGTLLRKERDYLIDMKRHEPTSQLHAVGLSHEDIDSEIEDYRSYLMGKGLSSRELKICMDIFTERMNNS